MAMSPDYNNYDPTMAFNPQTALSDVRNHIMDAYGRMNQGDAQTQPVGGGFGGGFGGGSPFGNLASNPFIQSLQGMNFPAPQANPLAGYGDAGGGWGAQPQGSNHRQSSGYGRTYGGGGYGGGAAYGGGNPGGTPPPMGGTPQAGGGTPQAGGTGGIAGYGLPVGQGVPGGDALAWLQSMGMPIPDFLSRIQAGMPVGPADYNQVVNSLGGMRGLPSPQTLGNLNDSEMQFLQGFFETVLGIPFGDIVNSAYRPFSGLGNAQYGQMNWQ